MKNPMNPVRTALLAALLLVGVLAALPPAVPPANAGFSVSRSLARVPLHFVENRGQFASEARYVLHGKHGSVFFGPAGLSLALRGAPAADAAPARHTLKVDFLGANPGCEPVGDCRTPALVSYFKGPKTRWKTGVRTYGRVVYRDLWPGIDLAYSADAARMKYEFLVRPGADPSRIRLAYRGATGVKIKGSGALEVSTPAGSLTDERPYAFQELGGRRREVRSSYVLYSGSSPRAAGGPGAAGHAYGFSLAHYDRARPLVIDPAVLLYAGYLGGGGFDRAWGIAVDGSGNAYVAGETTSTDFPALAGPDPSFNGGGVDAFVAKLDAGGQLVYAGFLGGAGEDAARDIAVDAAGRAVVTGFTTSPESSFPVTGGADLTYNGGLRDAFITRLTASGTGLDYSGYVGGSDLDQAFGVALDSAGNAYLAGTTRSDQATFPVTLGPDLTHNGGNEDTFVAKLDTGGAVVYAGYIGGSENDVGWSIAVDATGRAYVSGATTSDAVDSDGGGFDVAFPVTVGPDLSFNSVSGAHDAFVARVNAAGTALEYCGYIGGAGSDEGIGIAVDGTGRAYVTGPTASSEASFPVVGGPDISFNGGPGGFSDAFIARVNPSGTGLEYAGYLGGSSDELGWDVAVDAAGNAYVSGDTSSSEATFPNGSGIGSLPGPDLSYNGGSDAFIARVNAAGSGLDYAGYIGGSGGENGFRIAVDGAGNAYAAGATSSPESTFPDGDGPGALPGPDGTYNGGGEDGFAVKIAALAPPAGGTLKVKPRLDFGKVRRGETRTKPLELNNTSRTEELRVTIHAPSPPFGIAEGGGTVTIPRRGRHRVRVSFTPPAKGRASGSLTIDTSQAGRPTVSVTLAGAGR